MDRLFLPIIQPKDADGCDICPLYRNHGCILGEPIRELLCQLVAGTMEKDSFGLYTGIYVSRPPTRPPIPHAYRMDPTDTSYRGQQLYFAFRIGDPADERYNPLRALVDMYYQRWPTILLTHCDQCDHVDVYVAAFREAFRGVDILPVYISDDVNLQELSMEEVNRIADSVEAIRETMD